MKTVNNITQFFLNGVLRMTKELRAAGKKTLVEEINDVRLKTGDALDAPGVQDAMREAVNLQVITLLGGTVASVLDAINTAGRTLTQVATAKPEQDSDELKEKALEAAKTLAESLPVIKAMAATTIEGADIEHIATTLFEQELPHITAPEKAGSPVPPATPVAGKVTPLHPKWQPSIN